jgi:Domain of unknown function (DUF4381)
MKLKETAVVAMLTLACGSLGAQTADPPEDIRDIRAGSRGMLAQSSLLPAAAAVVLLLGAGGYGYWRWRRRGLRSRMLRPFELALQKLEEARSLMQPATSREFAGVVSDIVRHYIEQRFNVGVTQRTTQEFLQDLMRSFAAPLARQQPLLADFLQQSDLIKFAGENATAASLNNLLESARRFVRETVEPDAQDVSISAT